MTARKLSISAVLFITMLFLSWTVLAQHLRVPIEFANEGAASGLDFVLNNSPTSQRYLPETMAGGIAAFDFDNDGRLDLYFTNGAGLPGLAKTSPAFWNRLYRNDGHGHFTDVTKDSGLGGEGYSIAAAAGDFDNDGNVDLFVAGVGASHLYRNRGGGHFEDVTAVSGIHETQWGEAAAWFDYDRDGLLDLIVVHYVQWSLETNPLCHDPSGRLTVYCHPKEFKSTANTLYHNLGGGKFEDVSASSGIAKSFGKGMGVAIADYDRDGYPDIFITNDAMPNFLFHNQRNGRFSEVAFDSGVALPDNGAGVSGMGIASGDYDNDGLPDIFFTALQGQTFPLFRNAGKGQFAETSHASHLALLTSKLSGWGAAMADFDNDGWKDLFTANSHVTDNIEAFSGDRYRLANSIFLNRAGVFTDASPTAGSAFQLPRAHRGLVVADLDGDGRLDAVVSVLGERPELWRNCTSDAGHWIELKLIGSKSNRDAIGAEIRIGKQWNQVTSSTSYASSVLAPVHFGLGSQTEISDIVITWPSGVIQHLRNIRADQVLLVREESN
jgi:enediyne biosynthesis protein E4